MTHESSELAITLLREAPDISQLPSDALLTRKQMAALSGYTEQAFKKWAREGRGPVVTMVEGRPRYRVANARVWLGAGCTVSAEQLNRKVVNDSPRVSPATPEALANAQRRARRMAESQRQVMLTAAEKRPRAQKRRSQ